MVELNEDYDEIDLLIDTDPIALGKRCRQAEAVASHYERTGRDLAALGFTVGKWTDDVRHAEPCDCDLDEEQVGDRCIEASDWYWALMKDEGAHGWSLAYRLDANREDVSTTERDQP